MGIVKPKQTDLSSLVDSRIGVLDYNPAIMNVSSCVNAGGVNAYTSFSGASSTGFSAVSDGSGSHRAGTADELSVVAGKKYLIEFDFVLNSGAAPAYNLYSSLVGLPKAVESTLDAVAGHNSKVVTATETTTCVILFVSGTELANYTISNLSVNEWSGEELIPDPDVGFVANDVSVWGGLGGTDATQDGNAAKFTYVDDSIFYLAIDTSNDVLFADLNDGDKVNLIYNVKVNSGSNVRTRVYDGTSYGVENTYDNTNTEYETRVSSIIVDSGVPLLAVSNFNAGDTIWIEVLSVMKVTGLVAAYNMIPSPEGVLVDISGEGNNGAITLAPSTNEGMNFKGGSGSKVYISPSPIITTEQFTIAGRIKWDGKIGTLVDQVIFSNNNSTGDAIIDSFGLRADHFQWNYDVAGTYKYSAAGVAIPIGEWIDFVLSVNGERVHTLFINGDGDTGIEGGNLYRSGGGSGIGDRHTSSVGSSQPFSGEIEDIRLFNYAFSEQEAIDYHNSFQKLEKKNVFSDHPVGSTI